MSSYKTIILCANQSKENPISKFNIDNKYVYEYIIDILNEYIVGDIYLAVDDYNYYFFKNDLKYKNIKLIPISSDKKYSLHSLCSFDLEGDFSSLLVIDGNIIFDKKALSYLINNQKDNVAIVSNQRFNDNSFKAKIDNNIVTDILSCNFENKKRKEILGLFKLSFSSYSKLCELYYSGLTCSFDTAIIHSGVDLFSQYIDDFVWYELSDEFSIDEFKKSWLPRLQRCYSEKEYVERITNIFNNKINDKILKIEPLGGMTNKNFVVYTEGYNKYVIRIPGAGTDKLISRTNEKKNNYISSEINVDVKPIYFCELSGIKISPFIESAETLNPQTIRNYIPECLKILKCLHSSNSTFDNQFSIKNEIELYIKSVKDLNYYSGLSEYKNKVFSLIDEYEEIKFNKVSCHNDTVAENFIKSGDRFYIIDWEYSALNDPLWDLAALFLENNFEKEVIDLSLNYYFERSLTDDELFRLHCCYIFQDLLWTIWSVVKCEAGTDYYDYGFERFNRVKNNLEVI